jgi:hypothetical protein
LTHGSATLRVQEVLRRWGPPYLERFGARMPPRQRAVLERLLQCRTPALGGALFLCPACGQRHFRYHSCNDRHCPQCGGPEAGDWLEATQGLLLPVPYFLVTFTVPEKLRRWLRSHPQPGYDGLFAASAQALQDLAGNPGRLGATLGMLGLLHTWSRTLEHHPHVHYLVPGGGLSPDQRTWVPSQPRFLLRVEPLGDRCRTLFRETLAKACPEAVGEIPAALWRQRWVTHSAAVGNGQNALRYLSRYVFKTATGNRRLQLLPNGRLRWPYRQSATGQWQHADLQPFEFLRRFLQHVLPQGFHRVRRFGWLHPAGRLKANRVRALLGQPPRLTAAEQQAWLGPDSQEPAEPADATETRPAPGTSNLLHCPHCQAPLLLLGRWRAGARWQALLEHAPP